MPKIINKCAEKEKKILPLSSISKFNTVGSKESGKYTIFKNDKYGFKNKSNIYDKKKNKVLLIGDSMTHGPNVKIEEDIAGHLRKMNVNAFNYGGSGNGPLSNLATLKEYISVVKPKTVVWVHFENDSIRQRTDFFGIWPLSAYNTKNTQIFLEAILGHFFRGAFLDPV